MSSIKKKNYYDIIAGLSAFECSQEVILSPQDLLELVTEDTEPNDEPESTVDDKGKKRTTVHGYLGGKVDLNEASNASYDLSHTLLGGYVPKRQLESLSSIDFAHYFHKSLECEGALQVYDLLMGNDYRRLNLHINGNSSREDTTTTTTPPPNSIENESGDTRTNHNKVVRKAIICKKCGAKFVGSTRMKMLKKHSCNVK